VDEHARRPLQVHCDARPTAGATYWLSQSLHCCATLPVVTRWFSASALTVASLRCLLMSLSAYSFWQTTGGCWTQRWHVTAQGSMDWLRQSPPICSDTSAATQSHFASLSHIHQLAAKCVTLSVQVPSIIQQVLRPQIAMLARSDTTDSHCCCRCPQLDPPSVPSLIVRQVLLTRTGGYS
jgi:hypothetical protein